MHTHTQRALTHTHTHTHICIYFEIKDICSRTLPPEKHEIVNLHSVLTSRTVTAISASVSLIYESADIFSMVWDWTAVTLKGQLIRFGRDLGKRERRDSEM